MYKAFTCLLLLFLCLPVHKAVAAGRHKIGNISFKNAVTEQDAEPTGDFQTLIVPIKKAGNLIIVEAQVDSVEGNFVMDTGAPYLVLNESYFRDAPRINDQDAAGVNGDNGGAFTTVVHNFSILDLHYERLTADVTDLSSIENGRGIKILGLLGTRLFAKFSITIDVFHNLLYIQKLDKNGAIPSGEQVFTDPVIKVPFKLLNDIIFLKGTVFNRALWFVFDTGAETNLLDFNGSKKIVDSLTILSRSKLTGIGGSSFEVVYARFDKLVVGNRAFLQNRVLLTSLEKMGKAYDHSVSGILGYDFYSRGIFSINFVKKEFEMYIYNNQ